MSKEENIVRNPDEECRGSAEDLLLLIDFQNVYLPGQEWACPTMEQAMENVLRIIGSPDAPDYVLTQFLAPEEPVGCWQRYNAEYEAVNADPFLCGLADGIKSAASADNVLIKSTYSSMKCQPLLERLRGKKRVVLSGVVAECCVLATMMDAIDLGYEVIYLTDCVSGQSPENEDAILTLAKSFSPIHTQVMSSEEYLQSIRRNKK